MKTTRTTTTSAQICTFELSKRPEDIGRFLVALFGVFNETHKDMGISVNYRNDIHPTENPDGVIATIEITHVETLT